MGSLLPDSRWGFSDLPEQSVVWVETGELFFQNVVLVIGYFWLTLSVVVLAVGFFQFLGELVDLFSVAHLFPLSVYIPDWEGRH